MEIKSKCGCNSPKLDCGCNEPILNCGCSIKYDMLCAIYTGELLEKLDIKPGEDMNGVIKKINNYLRDFVLAQNVGATELTQGLVFKSGVVPNVVSPDATNLASAITLLNELKTKFNSKLQSDRNSGQQQI